MGTYPSFVVHVVSAVGLYFAALWLLWEVERRWGGVARHWIRLAQPALLVLLAAFFREAFDGQAHGPLKAFFDNFSWLLGGALATLLAHWLLQRGPLRELAKREERK